MKITRVDSPAPNIFQPFNVVIEVTSQEDLTVLQGAAKFLARNSARAERRSIGEELGIALSL